MEILWNFLAQYDLIFSRGSSSGMLIPLALTSGISGQLLRKIRWLNEILSPPCQPPECFALSMSGVWAMVKQFAHEFDGSLYPGWRRVVIPAHLKVLNSGKQDQLLAERLIETLSAHTFQRRTRH